MAIPADLPIPPELAVEVEPISDDDLDLYFDVMATTPGDGAGGPPEADLALAESVDRWQIDSDDLAEWALRKLAVAQEEVARLEQQALEWQRRIDEWFAQAAAPHRRRIAWATERLEDYALRLREAGGIATLTLPSGVLKTTVTKPAIEVADDAEVASWLETIDDREKAALWDDAMEAAGLALDSDEFVKRTPKVYVGPLRKVARIDERVLEHVAVVALGCDHELRVLVNGPDDLSVPQPGELMPCPVCPQDSLEGDQRRPVAAVVVEPVLEYVVVGPDGEAIPGAQVRPGGVTAKVETR